MKISNILALLTLGAAMAFTSCKSSDEPGEPSLPQDEETAISNTTWAAIVSETAYSLQFHEGSTATVAVLDVDAKTTLSEETASYTYDEISSSGVIATQTPVNFSIYDNTMSITIGDVSVSLDNTTGKHAPDIKGNWSGIDCNSDLVLVEIGDKQYYVEIWSKGSGDVYGTDRNRYSYYPPLGYYVARFWDYPVIAVLNSSGQLEITIENAEDLVRGESSVYTLTLSRK